MEPEIKNLGKVSATVEGEHRLNRDYKRLSIVNITQNNGTASYISKRYVPKNTSILDTYYWMPLVTPASGGGSSTIEGLTDVYIDNLINGQILVYNSLLDKWINGSNAANSYICTFTPTTDSQTDTEVYSCDKTISEIIAAANEGKMVIAKILESSEETETASFIPLNIVLNGVVIFGGLMATLYGNGLMTLYGVHNSSTDSDEWNSESSLLGTASQLDVPSSGNASSSQVVKGDDTRLTDSRPASDVSAWAKASTKPTYTASEVGAIPTTEKDSANGVATLNSNGKIPSHQLPSYVDDVLEYNSYSDLPATGERGKIYVTLDTNKTYRWGGSAYIEISESLALGETSSTAYPGDKGKANADYIAAIKDGNSIDSFGDVETALADKINKVSNPTNGNFAALDSNGNIIDSGHKHSDYLTSQQNADWNATSGAAKILNKPTIPDAVSGTNDGTNWTSLTVGSVTKNIPSGGGGGLTNYDFTPLSTPTISSNATTITFAANQRNCVELSTSTGSDLSIALISNNQSDNYIWITNSHGSADIDVIFSSIKFGTTTINDVKGTDSLPSIGHGETLEIGVYVTNSKARITSRIL